MCHTPCRFNCNCTVFLSAWSVPAHLREVTILPFSLLLAPSVLTNFSVFWAFFSFYGSQFHYIIGGSFFPHSVDSPRSLPPILCKFQVSGLPWSLSPRSTRTHSMKAIVHAHQAFDVHYKPFQVIICPWTRGTAYGRQLIQHDCSSLGGVHKVEQKI